MEQRLKLALEEAGVGSFDWYPQENKVEADDRIYEIFGMEKSSDINPFLNFTSILHPEDKQRILENAQALFNDTSRLSTFKDKYRILLDGKIRFLSTSGSIIRNENKEVVRVIGMVTDITKKVEADQLVKYQATLLNSISDSVVSSDTEFRITSWNPGAEKLFGWKSEEVVGKIFSEVAKVRHKENRKRAEVVKEFWAKGNWQGEMFLQRRNGEEFLAFVNVHAVKDEADKIIGSIALHRDITEQNSIKESLIINQERYRSLVEHTTDGIFCYEYHPPIPIDLPIEEQIKQQYLAIMAECNLQAAILNGFTSPEQVIGKTAGELFKIKYGGPTDALFKQFILNGYQNIDEIGVVTLKDNSTKYFLNNTQGVIIDGHLRRTWGSIREVTKSYQAEAALRESETRFRTVFNQQFQFMAILSTDGIVLHINDLPLKETGTRREEHIGQFFWEVPIWGNNKEWENKVKSQVQSAKIMNRPLITEDEYVHVDGTHRYAIAAYTAIKDENGNIQFIIFQATDITERKLAEVALRRTQEELKNASERISLSTKASKVGIWDLNVKDGTLFWDETMFVLYGFGRKRPKVTIPLWLNSVHPLDVERENNKIMQALSGSGDYNSEFRILWPDNSLHYIKALGTIQRDENGKPIRILGTNWDITKEKEVEEQKIKASQLQRANQELEQFAFVASHDLQEPLRSVIGFTDFLKRDYAHVLDEKGKTYLDFISKSSIQMNQLIKDLLDYSRLGRNQEKTVVNLNDLLRIVRYELKSSIETSGARFEIENLPTVNGLRGELRQLFSNLISNAIKFRKKDEPLVIKVSAEEKGEHYKISVSDNGIGISPKHKEDVFNIFYRLHTKAQFEGTGIGLAKCKKIIELHNGLIWVESMPGDGSKFFFSLPI